VSRSRQEYEEGESGSARSEKVGVRGVRKWECEEIRGGSVEQDGRESED
jgi:hypothetical protein